MYKEKIVDIVTGKETWRNYTAAEIKEVEESQAEAAIRIVELTEKAIARQAILKKLGLTEEEAKLLLL